MRPKAAQQRKTNDMKNTLLLAAATAALLTAVNTASADEPLLSPRANANLVRTVPGVTEDKLDRSLQPGSPKGREMAYSLRVVPSTGLSVDLALNGTDSRLNGADSELNGPGNRPCHR